MFIYFNGLFIALQHQVYWITDMSKVPQTFFFSDYIEEPLFKKK